MKKIFSYNDTNKTVSDDINCNVSYIHNINISQRIKVRSNSGRWYKATIVENTSNVIKLNINGNMYQIKKDCIKFKTNIY